MSIKIPWAITSQNAKPLNLSRVWTKIEWGSKVDKPLRVSDQQTFIGKLSSDKVELKCYGMLKELKLSHDNTMSYQVINSYRMKLSNVKKQKVAAC